MSNITVTTRSADSRSHSDRFFRQWLGIFLVVYGLWVWAPFLAPIFMQIGWSEQVYSKEQCGQVEQGWVEEEK